MVMNSFNVHYYERNVNLWSYVFAALANALRANRILPDHPHAAAQQAAARQAGGEAFQTQKVTRMSNCCNVGAPFIGGVI